MGIAEYLACAAVLIIIAVIGLLYSSVQNQAVATRPESVSAGSRPQPQLARPVTPASGPAMAQGRATPPAGYSQPKWQYKFKDIPRFNPQLGRCEAVRELVLVFE